MKFIISESDTKDIIQKTFNKIIKKDSFNWADSIDVELLSTTDMGWNKKDEMPLYNYIVNFKEGVIPENETQNELFDLISMYHGMIFNQNNKYSTPNAYFSVASRFPNGKIGSFPYFPY
jgi:hypothetical protein